jgi:hypothetical protein
MRRSECPTWNGGRTTEPAIAVHDGFGAPIMDHAQEPQQEDDVDGEQGPCGWCEHDHHKDRWPLCICPYGAPIERARQGGGA